MYSKKDWEDLLSLTPHEFRAFLKNNSIDEIGVVEELDWDVFYERMTDENPFSEHKGTWPDIFSNWYRKDNLKTHAIGILASSMTNANDDFEFFNNQALTQDLWRIEDYFDSLKRKVLSIYKSTTSKTTPSKRYYAVAMQNKDKWKDKIISILDDEYVVATCGISRTCDQQDVAWICNIIKERYRTLKLETLNTILKKFGIPTIFEALQKQGWPDKTICKKTLVRASKGTPTTITGYQYDEAAAQSVISSILKFSSTDKETVGKYLMKNYNWNDWTYTARVMVYDYFLTDEQLLNLSTKKKETILVDLVQEYTKLEEIEGKAHKKICARIFKLYNFSPILFDITDNFNKQHIQEVVAQHFKPIDTSVSIAELDLFN